MKNNMAIYLQEKRTKRGVALSMAMALGFMLVIIVCMLVSIATLNITTTQSTVSERDAYIQAKSALNFAESYYFSDNTRLPGGVSTTRTDVTKALVTFNADANQTTISEGAKVITIYDAAGTNVSSDELKSKEEDALTSGANAYVYVEYCGSKSSLVLTAVASLDGSNSSYELSKEYSISSGEGDSSSTFSGNISYDVNSSSKYLRIHVRPSSDATYNPYLYTWAQSVNTTDDTTGKAYGTSSIVNHLTKSYNAGGSSNTSIADDENNSITLSGEWNSVATSTEEKGPQGAMDYEGNGWYLYTIEIPDSYNINTVNAIVSAKGSTRSDGYKSQSWEIFGIPIPTEAGEANGVDVYITLNYSQLQDAQNSTSTQNYNTVSSSYGSSSYVDDLSRWYNGAGNYTSFAQFTSQYYSVYTKKDLETVIYYRYAYDVSDYSTTSGDVTSPTNPGSSGDYVGYGWYRDVSTNTTVSVSCGGNTYTIDSNYVVSQNEYGKEQIREAYIVTDGSTWYCCKTEEDANDKLVNEFGDTKAGDYVTVYAQGDDQPVNREVTTTLEYESTYISSDIDIEPDATWSTNPSNSSYTATVDTATATSYYIGGSMYESDYMTEMFSSSEGYTYTFTNMMPGTYTYNIYNGDGTTVGSSLLTTGSITIEYVCNATITYDSSSNLISLTTDPDSGDTVNWVYVGFYNDVLTDTSGNSVTSFTSPWTEVYVNYTIGTNTGCIKLDSSYTTTDNDGKSIWWVRIPDNTDSFYFSNLPTSQKSDADYQRTSEITSFSESSFYYPKTSSGTSPVTWSVGTKSSYRSIKVSATTVSDTRNMVYTGTNKVAYYDIPIVDLLDALSGGSGRIYASRCWTNYDLKLNSSETSQQEYSYGSFTFNSTQYVEYQGEKYYWVNSGGATSTSILIMDNAVSVNTYYDSYGNAITYGGAAYLYAGDFAVKEKRNTANSSAYLVQYENLRDGATYTSSGEYYDGSTSPINYGDYVPGWYTYKIPAYSTYIINSITGLDGDNTTKKITTAGQEIEVVDSAKSVYITYKSSSASGSSSLGMYTFDVDSYQVDTNNKNKDAIYFDASASGWDSDKIYVHAVGINGTDDLNLSLDVTDGDTSYYICQFTSGNYCFFTFYTTDGTNNDYADAIDETTTYYFTGSQTDDREYQILAVYGNDTLQYYKHPRTKALYAYQDLLGAYNSSAIYLNYDYDIDTGAYTAKENMTYLSAASQYADVKSYYDRYDSDSDAVFTASGSGDYADLADAATDLVSAIKKARVYLDGYIDGSTTYHFPEGQNADGLVTYTAGSLYSLWNAYSSAISLYSNNYATAAQIESAAQNILDTISSMNYTISADAVQIIVSDVRASSDTTSKWGKNAVLWGWDTSSNAWVNTGISLLTTTQSDYYAFLFDISGYSYTQYTITSGSTPTYDITNPDDADHITTLGTGSRCNFYTTDSTWKEDNSLPTYTLDATSIKEGEATAVYAEIVTPRDGYAFNLYVKYDCEVTYGSTTYTIFAGEYRISSQTYSVFTTQLLSGYYGMNLFSSDAEEFFSTGGSGYLSMADDYDSSSYQDASGTTGTYTDGTVTDIMCKDVTGQLNVENDTINFRFENTSGNTLTLSYDVNLKADEITIAVNTLDLTSADFIIDKSVKTIVFYTDVTVTYSGGTYTIERGTYSVSSATGSLVNDVDLSDPDWTSGWVKLSENNGNISGGTYVTT